MGMNPLVGHKVQRYWAEVRSLPAQDAGLSSLMLLKHQQTGGICYGCEEQALSMSGHSSCYVR